jgi:hypothetical protein
MAFDRYRVSSAQASSAAKEQGIWASKEFNVCSWLLNCSEQPLFAYTLQAMSVSYVLREKHLLIFSFLVIFGKLNYNL